MLVPRSFFQINEIHYYFLGNLTVARLTLLLILFCFLFVSFFILISVWGSGIYQVGLDQGNYGLCPQDFSCVFTNFEGMDIWVG